MAFYGRQISTGCGAVTGQRNSFGIFVKIKTEGGM